VQRGVTQRKLGTVGKACRCEIHGRIEIADPDFKPFRSAGDGAAERVPPGGKPCFGIGLLCASGQLAGEGFDFSPGTPILHCECRGSAAGADEVAHRDRDVIATDSTGQFRPSW